MRSQHISFQANKILFLFSLVFVSSYSFSQTKDSVNNYSEKTSMEWEVFGDYFFNSSALNTEFVKTFYTSGFISPEIKDRVSSKLKYRNRFGADLNYGFTFRC